MMYNKKRIFLYSLITLLILVGVYFVYALDNIGNLRFTDNTTDTYDTDGTFNINWTSPNETDSGYTNPVAILMYRINYTIEGSKDNGASVVIGRLENLSQNLTLIVAYNLSNTSLVSGNYTFRVNATLSNLSGNIVNSTTSNISIFVDVNDPTPTITEPSDKTINVFNNIKYTCASSDTGSGVSTCTFKVTKPSGSVVDLSCGSEQEITATTTNEAGDYTVECKVTDRAGRTTTKTATFKALYGSVGGGAVGEAGGGGTTREAPVEVPEGVTRDLGTLTSAETFTTLVRNSKVSFVVAGSSHTVKVLDVTADSATIEVSSTPSQFTLTIGESQEVDVDDNGVNDLIVTLSSITDSKADLSFKVIEAPPEEEVPTEEVPPEAVTGEEVKPSLTWLWVVIVIVVVVLLIWYFSRRKR